MGGSDGGEFFAWGLNGHEVHGDCARPPPQCLGGGLFELGRIVVDRERVEVTVGRI